MIKLLKRVWKRKKNTTESSYIPTNPIFVSSVIDVDPATITSGHDNGDVVIHKCTMYIFVTTGEVSGTGKFYKC